MFAGVTSSGRATCPNTEMRRRDRRWDRQTAKRQTDVDGPFDILGRLGDEETLNVRLELQLRSRVDRQTTVVRVRLASFDGDQQQLQPHETQPVNSTHATT